MTQRISVEERVAIVDLSAFYMRGLDRLDRDLVRGVFWPDAWCSYGSYEGGAEGFADFAMRALASHAANQHMLGQILLERDGPDVFGEVYYQAFHRTPDEGEGPRDLFISGRYVDRYEARDGQWRIAWRRELVDWVREGPVADGWFDGSPMIAGARKPHDSLYDRQAMYARFED